MSETEDYYDNPDAGLPVCWECLADDEPWCFDCDQCNPDGMYDKSGRVRPDYIEFNRLSKE